MTTRIDLPNGGWAELKTMEQLTNRERKLIQRHSLPAAKIAATLRDRMRGTDLDQLRSDPTAVSPELGERVADALTADDFDRLGDIQSALIVVHISSWSIGDQAAEAYGDDLAAVWAPHPGSKADVLVSTNPTMDTVDDLPGPVYDAFATATAVAATAPDFGVDGVVDPASPTMPSPV